MLTTVEPSNTTVIPYPLVFDGLAHGDELRNLGTVDAIIILSLGGPGQD